MKIIRITNPNSQAKTAVQRLGIELVSVYDKGDWAEAIDAHLVKENECGQVILSFN